MKTLPYNGYFLNKGLGNDTATPFMLFLFFLQSKFFSFSFSFILFFYLVDGITATGRPEQPLVMEGTTVFTLDIFPVLNAR